MHGILDERESMFFGDKKEVISEYKNALSDDEPKKPSTENNDVDIQLNVDLEGERKEYYDIAKKLGLTRQMVIIKLESLGFKFINRDNSYKLLGFRDPKAKELISLTAFIPLNEYTGKIPFKILKKIEEVNSKNIFDKIFVIAKPGEVNAILIGEKFTSCDERTLPKEQEHMSFSSREDYPSSFGYRNRNFWERNTIIMLIAQWGQDEKEYVGPH